MRFPCGDSHPSVGIERGRPWVIRQQQFEAAYVFGSVCPAERKAAALVMPQANSESMKHHLYLIAAAVAPGKHDVLGVDQVAWHVTEKLLMPANLSILPLPPYLPELNPLSKYSSSYGNRIGLTGASRL